MLFSIYLVFSFAFVFVLGYWAGRQDQKSARAELERVRTQDRETWARLKKAEQTVQELQERINKATKELTHA